MLVFSNVMRFLHKAEAPNLSLIFNATTEDVMKAGYRHSVRSFP